MTLDTLTFRDSRRTRWNVVPAWRDRLFAGDVFLPDELVASRTQLKKTDGRLVEEIGLVDGGSLILKHYAHRSGLEGLKRLLPHGAAEAEWDHGVAFLEAGLPCAEPVAFGRFPGEGDEPAAELLVTLRIEGARELAWWWGEGALGPRDRHALVRAFARLIRGLHDAGLAHEDPHLGNFLARDVGDEPGEATWEVVPIDLRRVRRVAAGREAARDEHLLLLFQAMAGLTSRADRSRFLSTYLEDAPQGDRRARASRLEDAGEQRSRQYRRRRSAAALGANRRFEILEGAGEGAGITWHVRQELRDPALDALLADPEAAFEAPDEVLKEGGSAQVVAVGGWVVKRMRPRHRRHLVMDRLRPGKALRAMRMAFLMEICGLSTPGVAAAGKRVEGGLVHRSYLISRRLPGALHLDVALVRNDQARRELLESAAELVGRLHGEMLTHRDLKAGNLIVDTDLEPWFVDLDGVRMRKSVAPGRRAHDLARLFRDLRSRAATTPDEERVFVTAYARAAGIDENGVSPLLALIEGTPRLHSPARRRE